MVIHTLMLQDIFVLGKIKARKLVSVTNLMDLRPMPSSKPACIAWLRRYRVDLHAVGCSFFVKLTDLPVDVQRAYELREIEAAGLDAGVYDDAAHDRFDEATPTMQAAALRKAEIARFMMKGGAALGLPHSLPHSLTAAVQQKFGSDGTNEMTLRRILRKINGVDPINYAPALLPPYSRVGRAKAEISDDAWALFMTIVRDAAPQFPLKQAWRDVRDSAVHRGWHWARYRTVMRRWEALPESQRLAARLGRAEAISQLTMPAKRDKTTIRPLEWVSLDGRTQDFWVDFGDGKPVRPVMLALVDVASNYVLGYEIARSENAVATGRLIRDVCQKHGIFQRLYTDNGSAFAGHLVAGGATFKWRGKATGKPGVKRLGVCYHLGIDVKFALPKNARAKIAERTFAALSRVIDDRPEFKGAHAGHAPGASPDKNVVPVPVGTMENVIRREIDRHNREAGRTGQGARGRSYEQIFADGLADAIICRPTAKQLHLASLIYTPASVNRWGQVQIDRWTYGGPDTQDELLRWHGQGQILIARDPDNFDAPAMAFDDSGRLICRDIMPVKAGAYDSVDGVRDASRQRKAARAAVAQAEVANAYLDGAAMEAALAQLGAPEATPTPKSAKVVGGKFGGLQPARRAEPEAAPRRKSHLTPEMIERMDRATGWKPASGSGGSV